MYYIRILRPPGIRSAAAGNIRGKQSNSVDSNIYITTKITITNDLRDLFCNQDISLSTTILGPDLMPIQASNHTCLWNGSQGMRALELKVSLPQNISCKGVAIVGTLIPKVKLWIRAIESKHVSSVESFKEVLLGHKIGILSVRSMWIDLSGQDPTLKENTHIMERVFNLGSEKELLICEETGESIAKHIWDAGLVLSACITSILCPSDEQVSSTVSKEFLQINLPIFTRLLLTIKNQPETSMTQSSFHILELGAGCGIVSLTLFCCLARNEPQKTTHLTLTDLPAASSILELNMALSSKYLYPHLQSNQSQSSITHMVLDWTATLPVFITKTKWDLVLVADCTYNPDVIPDLVATLGRIKTQVSCMSTIQRENQYMGNLLASTPIVIIALKERHPSEHILFILMEREQWQVVEECVITLPDTIHPEEIRIFVFAPKADLAILKLL